MSRYGLDPVLFEGVSAVTATPSVEIGTKRTYAGEEYIYVHAVGTVSMSVGATLSGVSGYSVLATGLLSGAYCIGFCKHESIVCGSYGWLIQRGFVSSPVNGMANSSIAATRVIMLAADGKIADAQSESGITDTAKVLHHIIGRMTTSVVSGGTGGSNAGAIYINVA